MHILCLTDAFWPDHTGGVSKSLLPEIEGLAKLGHQITVITRRLHTTHPRHESRTGYELYRYTSLPKGSIFYQFYPLFSLILLPGLIRRLHREQPFDVAYIHNPFQAAALMRIADIPFVYNYHASAANEIQLDAERGKYGKRSFLARLVIYWVKMVERKVLSKANQLITESDFMKQDMSWLYQVDVAKIRRVPLCVDTTKFRFAENTIAARKELDLPTDRTILLTVRRLVARMGLENLIDAMRFVVSQFPDILLLIGGTGYLKDELSATINRANLESNIHLLGFIPEEYLASYYQAADLFVLPTLHYEGFGLVTLEALACGTPVIATPVGASPEILKPIGLEFLFNDSTPEAIADGLKEWLNRGFENETRRRCWTFFVANFSQEQVCRELEYILNRVTLNADKMPEFKD